MTDKLLILILIVLIGPKMGGIISGLFPIVAIFTVLYLAAKLVKFLWGKGKIGRTVLALLPVAAYFPFSGETALDYALGCAMFGLMAWLMWAGVRSTDEYKSLAEVEQEPKKIKAADFFAAGGKL